MESGEVAEDSGLTRPVTQESGTPDRWWVLLLVALDYFVLYLHRSVIFFVLPPLIAELHLTDEQVGNLQMAFIIPYGVLQLFVGYFGDRFRRRTVLICSISTAVVALAGLGLARNYWDLLILRVLLGIAQSASVPAIASIMADSFTPKFRSTAVSIYLVSLSLSQYVAAKYGGKIADTPAWEIPSFGLTEGAVIISGWRMSMFVFGLVGAAVGLLLFFFLREPERTERDANHGIGPQGAPLWRTVTAVLKVPSFLILAGVFVLMCAVANVREAWLARYLHDEFLLKNEEAGALATFWILLSTGVGLFVGGVLADHRARRFRSARTLVQAIGILAIVPAIYLVGQTESMNVLVMSLVVVGFGSGLYTANLWTTTFEVVDPAARATAVGLLNVFAAVFAGGASKVVGGLVDRDMLSLGDAISVLSGLAAGAVVLLLINALFLLRRDYRGQLQ